MSLQLRPEHLRAILHNGETSYPHEGCGLLLGREADGEKIVEQVMPAGNARESEEQYHRYLIPPEVMLQAEQSAARQGLDIIGFFHSHPDHPERPSDFDREHAWPWYSYVITSIRQGRAAATTSWTLADDRAAFEPEPLTVTRDK